jgi:fructose-1,6-bisphosphatase I
LITGGIYIYPTTTKSPKGKLRLLYECNPLAFILEQAGGKASTGGKRIMDLPITELHQRTPLFLGSSEMVDVAQDFMTKYSSELI